MSIENLNKLMKEISADSETVMKMKNAHAKGAEAVVEFAKEYGCEITVEDVRQFNARMKKSAQSVLAPCAEDSGGIISLKKFIKASEENPEIKNRLITIGFGDSAAVAAYAGELGFVFAAEDIAKLSRQMMSESGELTDDELDAVAGGNADYYNCSILTITIDGW